MSTKSNLEKLAQIGGDDPFDFIGRMGKTEPEPKPEPEKPEPKQISARIPLDLYRRLKLHVAATDESQNGLLVRLIEDHLDRSGA
jgi:hypothetical protein